MSNSATTIDWEEDLFDDADSLGSRDSDDPVMTRKQRLDIRRKLEDRMEMKRLREELGDLDESWLD